jgi:protein ImuB
MRRFVSVWLPQWPIERRRWQNRQSNGNGRWHPEDIALVQVMASQHGLRITAATSAAQRLGLRIDMPLADARAIYPSVSVETADPDSDAAALRRLALWCRRYSPWTTAHAPDGLAIEITGCAHLFSDEPALLDDLRKRLDAFGLTARLAVAPTIGAAWAVARYAEGRNRIIDGEDARATLVPLPLAAMRLDEDMTADLAVMGLQRVGDLLGKPRAPLTARFGPHVLRRLDQALGLEDETFHPLAPPTLYCAECRFAEPIVQTEAIEHAVERLSQDLSAQLVLAGRGTRSVALELFRVDGHLEALTVRTSSLCCTPEHIARLFRERIEQMGDDLDAGFGFDVMRLSACDVEAFIAKQEILETGNLHAAPPEALGRLLDRLVNRCGSQSLVRFVPRTSHIPERAAKASSVLKHEKKAHDWEAHLRMLQGSDHMGRPLVLLSPPEPITALSEVPDGPPVRFVWNRVSHRVTRADGPERIAPEWWLYAEGSSRRTRDYYRVEDDAGRRYWLFRDGLHDRGDDASPTWFMHGLFA